MKNTRKRKGNTSAARLSKARLDELVAEAIVDCHDESEQATGLYTMITDNLALPFAASVLGGRVAQPFGFRPHGSERAAFPHSAPPEGYPTRAKDTSRG